MKNGLEDKAETIRQLLRSIEKDIQQLLEVQDYGKLVKILYFKLKISPDFDLRDNLNQVVHNYRCHRVDYPVFIPSSQFIMANTYSDFEFLLIKGIVKSVYYSDTQTQKRSDDFNGKQLAEDIADRYSYSLAELL